MLRRVGTSILPSKLRHSFIQHLLIPVKAGILQTISQKDFEDMQYIKFGVYHCIVEKPNDDNLRRLIWINPKNYYTHYELSYIREKGIKITMIDEPNNFLHYPRNYCKTGSEIFGEYGKTLYKLKEDGVTGAKNLLNHIWGMVTKPNKSVKIHNVETDGMLEIDDLDNPPIPLGGNLWKITKLREQKFEYDLARMKPFFLAKCRLTMVKVVEPHIEHIYYSHTDSIISGVKLDLKDDGKVGSFRYEGCCKEGFITDHNTRSPNKDFKI